MILTSYIFPSSWSNGCSKCMRILNEFCSVLAGYETNIRAEKRIWFWVAVRVTPKWWWVYIEICGEHTRAFIKSCVPCERLWMFSKHNISIWLSVRIKDASPWGIFFLSNSSTNSLINIFISMGYKSLSVIASLFCDLKPPWLFPRLGYRIVLILFRVQNSQNKIIVGFIFIYSKFMVGSFSQKVFCTRFASFDLCAMTY